MAEGTQAEGHRIADIAGIAVIARDRKSKTYHGDAETRRAAKIGRLEIWPSGGDVTRILAKISHLIG